MIRPSPPTNPKPAILALTHIRRGEGAPSALRSPGNDPWLRWRGPPDASHVFFCHRLPSPLRSGPTVLHRLSLLWPQVRPRDPPPWDTVASCCAPFLLCICRRRSRVSKGGRWRRAAWVEDPAGGERATGAPARRFGRPLRPPGALPQPRRPKHYL